MPMTYANAAIPEADVPRGTEPLLQHALDTYASETNKVVSVWRAFADAELPYRPNPRSSTVLELFRHQLLSERRFFGEFLGAPEPPAEAVLPREERVAGFATRVIELARPRLPFLASREGAWWLERVRFFDVERERAWVFWRRVLHTAHHRAQLTVYLRLLGKEVPPTYGPTADVSWQDADPTRTVDAAQRR
ncbi:MAG TPA: DinB family protein [Gemmatimonadales bacterium]|nr:DinB family protein [Gemmatimonadales bacterium]